jgi:hypothetical protein
VLLLLLPLSLLALLLLLLLLLIAVLLLLLLLLRKLLLSMLLLLPLLLLPLLLLPLLLPLLCSLLPAIILRRSSAADSADCSLPGVNPVCVCPSTGADKKAAFACMKEASVVEGLR